MGRVVFLRDRPPPLACRGLLSVVFWRGCLCCHEDVSCVGGGHLSHHILIQVTSCKVFFPKRNLFLRYWELGFRLEFEGTQGHGSACDKCRVQPVCVWGEVSLPCCSGDGLCAREGFSICVCTLRGALPHSVKFWLCTCGDRAHIWTGGCCTHECRL